MTGRKCFFLITIYDPTCIRCLFGIRVEGKRYFTCRPSYGAFIRPDKIEVGDFPEIAFEDEEM